MANSADYTDSTYQSNSEKSDYWKPIGALSAEIVRKVGGGK